MNLIHEILEKIEAEKIGSRNHVYYTGMLLGALKMINRVEAPKVVKVKTPEVETPEIVAEVNEVEAEAVEKPVKKILVAYKCEECNHTVIVKVDPEQPHACKCGNYHHFGYLSHASYYCECSAQYRLMIENDVDRIKCRGCGHEHHLIFNEDYREYRSVDDTRGN